MTNILISIGTLFALRTISDFFGYFSIANYKSQYSRINNILEKKESLPAPNKDGNYKLKLAKSEIFTNLFIALLGTLLTALTYLFFAFGLGFMLITTIAFITTIILGTAITINTSLLPLTLLGYLIIFIATLLGIKTPFRMIQEEIDKMKKAELDKAKEASAKLRDYAKTKKILDRSTAKIEARIRAERQEFFASELAKLQNQITEHDYEIIEKDIELFETNNPNRIKGSIKLDQDNFIDFDYTYDTQNK